jgi:predicted PurR-regulated permease PerM
MPGFFLSLTAQYLTDLILPLVISGVIAAVISAVFYRIKRQQCKRAI